MEGLTGFCNERPDLSILSFICTDFFFVVEAIVDFCFEFSLLEFFEQLLTLFLLVPDSATELGRIFFFFFGEGNPVKFRFRFRFEVLILDEATLSVSTVEFSHSELI